MVPPQLLQMRHNPAGQVIRPRLAHHKEVTVVIVLERRMLALVAVVALVLLLPAQHQAAVVLVAHQRYAQQAQQTRAEAEAVLGTQT